MTTPVFRSNHGLTVLSLALLLGACKEPEEDFAGFTTTTTTTTEGLQWTGCGPADMVCVDLEVPLDHADPDIGTTRLTLALLPAGNGAPEGVIFVNPGGPGGDTQPFLSMLTDLLPELTERYDVAAVDPRGSGDRPLGCLQDADALLDIDLAPTTLDGVHTMLDASRAWGERCMETDGDLIPYATLPDMADDVAFAATALEYDTFGFYGISAGTQLGALLAENHGERLWAVALDSVIGTVDRDTATAEQFEGLIGALGVWEAWCLTTDPSDPYGDLCPLTDPLADLDNALDIARSQQLVDADTGRQLNHTRALYGGLASLYNEFDWPALGLGVADIQNLGDPYFLLMMHDNYFVYDPDFGFRSGLFAAFNVLSCAYGSTERTAEQVLADIQANEQRMPHYGSFYASEGAICEGLPPSRRPLTGPVTAPNAPPILLLQSEGDFATPLAGAERVNEALHDSAMVLWSGSTHGTAFASECARQELLAYFDTGTLPPDGIRCTD